MVSSLLFIFAQSYLFRPPTTLCMLLPIPISSFVLLFGCLFHDAITVKCSYYLTCDRFNFVSERPACFVFFCLIIPVPVVPTSPFLKPLFLFPFICPISLPCYPCTALVLQYTIFFNVYRKGFSWSIPVMTTCCPVLAPEMRPPIQERPNSILHPRSLPVCLRLVATSSDVKSEGVSSDEVHDVSEVQVLNVCPVTVEPRTKKTEFHSTPFNAITLYLHYLLHEDFYFLFIIFILQLS